MANCLISIRKPCLPTRTTRIVSNSLPIPPTLIEITVAVFPRTKANATLSASFVGGIGSALGKTVGGVTNTVGDTVGGLGNTAGSAAQGIGQTLSGATEGLGNATKGAGQYVNNAVGGSSEKKTEEGSSGQA